MRWRWKKGGGGAPLFSSRQDPDLFFRSLFGFGTVEFGIAAVFSFFLYITGLLPIFYQRYVWAG
jgi:hypothetical protein